MNKERVSAQNQLFLDYYFGEATLNASKAAELAGYKHPKETGYKLLKKLAEPVEKKRQEMSNKLEAGAEELRQRLTLIARDPDHKDHLRAIELGLKIHGQLSEKVSVNVDRRALEKEMAEVLSQLGGVKVATKQAN